MRFITVSIILIFSISVYSQNLTIDDLINFSKQTPNKITDYLINRNWKFDDAENSFSDDGSLLLLQKADWHSTNKSNCIPVSIYYKKILKVADIEISGYYKTIDIYFKSSEYFHSLKQQIQTKKLTKIQEGIIANEIFENYTNSDISVAFFIENRDDEQIFSVTINNLKPEKL